MRKGLVGCAGAGEAVLPARGSDAGPCRALQVGVFALIGMERERYRSMEGLLLSGWSSAQRTKGMAGFGERLG